MLSFQMQTSLGMIAVKQHKPQETKLTMDSTTAVADKYIYGPTKSRPVLRN